MKKLLTLGLLLLSLAFVSAQTPDQVPQQPTPKTNPSVAQMPVEPVLPYTPSLDVNAIDKSVDPCGDFYQYSCGGWKKNNPIPPDQTSWSVYGKLYQDNLNFLRGILEEAAQPNSSRDAITQKIGDFYAACMDESAVEKRGIAPIKSDLDAIAHLKSSRDLAPLVAHLQLATEGSGMLFGGGSTQDPDNSEQQIAGLDQGGLGLPDRDYYTKDDAKSKENRDKYLQHVQKIFELLGDNTEAAKKNADTVMQIETALAKSSLTRVERRDPYKLKNKMNVAQLNQLTPNFNWQAYFQAVNAPKFEILNVTAPAFFKELNTEIGSQSIADWKTYLRFHLANAYSPYLSSPFVTENFEFYRKYLRGAKEQQPRWKRCVQYVDRDLGEALGQVYVRKVFSPELKASTLDMVKRIEDAMELRIKQLDWMSAQTKEQALLKLHSIRNKIGQPVDRGEWGMTPPTVNAYYNPQMNDINFPAGVLQPPLYDAKLDDAPNYGNTGGTIGHELTHGFDDEGRQFDAKGNLKDWWTREDAEKFEQRTRCIQDQYAQYVVVDDVHINSKLTLGEDVADLGGEILGYIAWQDATKGRNLQPVNGLTPEQRFFIGFAQWDCTNERPEDMRVRAITDPHSPAKYRINGVVVNMPEFSQAFSCKENQPMAKPADKICKVW